jgi:hypothetical protein
MSRVVASHRYLSVEVQRDARLWLGAVVRSQFVSTSKKLFSQPLYSGQMRHYVEMQTL